MAFKVNSLLVRLLATLATTAVLVTQQVAAQDCVDEGPTCEADAVCNECYNVGSTFNQAYEECYASHEDFLSACDSYMLTACCQHQVSENDCIANEPFLAYWWCEMCNSAFPSVEACAEVVGIIVTSGGSTGTLDTPAPTAGKFAPQKILRITVDIDTSLFGDKLLLL